MSDDNVQSSSFSLRCNASAQPKGCTLNIVSSLITQHSSLFYFSLFASGINVEECGDDDQHQTFHEDEEAPNERAVFKVRVGPGDERSQRQTTHQPD